MDLVTTALLKAMRSYTALVEMQALHALPIEHILIHSKKTLQHTKHAAPMPKPEKGDGKSDLNIQFVHRLTVTCIALPGMNASGGAAAPLNDASEEYGASAPRNERLSDGTTTDSTSESYKTSTGSSSSFKTHQSSQQSSSTREKSGHDTHGFHEENGKHDLESISREKAERYVNLNEEDVQHAGTANKSSSGVERSSQRAPKEVGPKEDIEQLHGKASLAGNDKAEERGHGKSRNQGNESKGQAGHGRTDSGKGNEDSAGENDLSSMRHQAEKFVNLEE
jgi:hypothetical protein